ncbi:MAG TPA: DNA recombination protein RmuC [Terracidiphilus sp.]|nr:DNA recombination protein RmuC [Terracidiphilus sp.]
MTLAIVAILALVAGLAIGYWMRSHAAKTQVDAARTEKSMLEQSFAGLSAELGLAKSQIEQLRAESASRAGFESLANERQAAIERLNADVETKSASEKSLTAAVSKLEADLRNERQNMAEKLALLETAKQTLANQFQTLAADILDAKTKSFSEASLKDLQPLREQLENFRKRVDQVQTESTTSVTELKTLIGTLGTLNKSLTEEAHNLSTALRRDTKMQGNWGETILRNILDKSGLKEGIHYTYQESFTEVNADGEPGQRRQTDVVVKLPGHRHLIIDSKVSLNSYRDSVNAEDDAGRKVAIKKHLQSVRTHYSELSSRSYQSLNGVQSPDFVVMFVPIEPAFLLALQEDETIWQDAYSKGVLLAGPTTILFVVRIVEDLWKQEQKARNVESVMRRGSELYDKFVGFISNLESVGEALVSARSAYEAAMGQLSTGSGNLVGQVEKLRQLGVSPKITKSGPKVIPAKLLEHAEADDSTLSLAAEGEETPDRTL